MGPSGVAPASYSYTYGTNRLADLDGVSIITDPTGNITDGGNGVTFIYGLRNRMTSSTNAQGTTTYSYNALGERVKKSGPGGTTIFTYDEEGHLIGEYNSAGGLIQEIVWLEGLPVASLRPAVSGGGIEIFNISSDHLGTPRVIRRATDGVVVWRWDSDPFGVASPNENPSGAGDLKFNLRFPGQYADAETGLNHNYFRDYNPKTGRYMQSDPIGLNGGLNTYLYAQAQPVVLTDPKGLDVYKCIRPLHAFGGTGTRSGPDVPFNPFFHQFLCIQTENNVVCGGQDMTPSWALAVLGTPGRPSQDTWPEGGAGCKKVDTRDCMDTCVQARVQSSERPFYGIPAFTDCQDWSDTVVLQCAKMCVGSP